MQRKDTNTESQAEALKDVPWAWPKNTYWLERAVSLIVGCALVLFSVSTVAGLHHESEVPEFTRVLSLPYHANPTITESPDFPHPLMYESVFADSNLFATHGKPFQESNSTQSELDDKLEQLIVQLSEWTTLGIDFLVVTIPWLFTLVVTASPLITRLVGLFHTMAISMVKTLAATIHTRYDDGYSLFVFDMMSFYAEKDFGTGLPILHTMLLFTFYYQFVKKLPVAYFKVMSYLFRIPVEVLPFEADLEFDDTGDAFVEYEAEFTPRFCSYPLPCGRYPDSASWLCIGVKWHPLKTIKRFVHVKVRISAIADLVVSKILSTPPPQPKKTEEQDLEMSVPNSQMSDCAPPSTMGVIHCSPAGSPDLSNFPYAAVGRIREGKKTYLVTAMHVVESLLSHESFGKQLYIRFQGNDIKCSLSKHSIYMCSPVNQLDFCLIEVPDSFWCQISLKAAKLARTLRPTDSITAYTPTPTGAWQNAIGTVKGHSSKLFQFSHSASTNHGASGGLLFNTSKGCVGIHLRRDPEKGLNVGVALKYLLRSASVLESSEGDYDMFGEREPDYGDDEYDSDASQNDFSDDDDYRHSVSIYGKAGHREFTAHSRSSYTQKERDADFAKGDTAIATFVPRMLRYWADLDDSDMDYSGNPFAEVKDDKIIPAPVPPTPVVEPAPKPAPPVVVVPVVVDVVPAPLIGAPTPSTTAPIGIPLSTVKGVTPSTLPVTPPPSPTSLVDTNGASSEKKMITSSSAPQNAGSLQVGGKKRNKRRQKKKKKSPVSANGTSPTLPQPDPTPASDTKPVSESKVKDPTPKLSKKSRRKSSANTQKPRNLTDSDITCLGNVIAKSFKDALLGSSPKKSQKTASRESPILS